MIFRRRIYLDYASLTPIDPRVSREMRKFSAGKYANPSSWYREGVAAKKASDRSRKIVAEFVHAHPDEIIFTSGGTESNTLAIRGAFHAFTKTRKAGDEKPHLVISSIEHSSIMVLAEVLENEGCEVTRIGVDGEGRVDLDELKASLRPSTFLVSVMSVNNEIGTIQPIREIAKIIRNHRKQRQQMSSPQAAMLDLSYPLFTPTRHRRHSMRNSTSRSSESIYLQSTEVRYMVREVSERYMCAVVHLSNLSYMVVVKRWE